MEEHDYEEIDVDDICDDDFHMGGDFSGRSKCMYCGGDWQVKSTSTGADEKGT